MNLEKIVPQNTSLHYHRWQVTKLTFAALLMYSDDITAPFNQEIKRTQSFLSRGTSTLKFSAMENALQLKRPCELQFYNSYQYKVAQNLFNGTSRAYSMQCGRISNFRFHDVRQPKNFVHGCGLMFKNSSVCRLESPDVQALLQPRSTGPGHKASQKSRTLSPQVFGQRMGAR